MLEVASNTPVLIGAATVQQKTDHADEPLALMERALRLAGVDTGLPDSGVSLLGSADEIMVPKGIWNYSDPARLLGQALGADSATTVLAEIGILQQSLITRACQRIVQGDAQVVLVTGGEAKYRALIAAKAGQEASETSQVGAVPDVFLEPEAELWSPVESAAGLGMPVGYYAILDSALRYRQKLSVAQHRNMMADMYARFSEIAAANPDAWSDQAVNADKIREASEGNRMLAFPYTKLHNSQWNVDQAAGLIFCSAGMASRLGVPRGQWIFPRASTESNFMSVVSSRAQLGHCEGFRVAGEVAMANAGVSFDEIRLRELYSCFPVAVRMQLEEFGMDGNGDLSVTGAMTFGGGPLNNFVLQATATMAQLLRRQPTEIGLVTSVSGMLTKQACALWSATANASAWSFEDVSEQVRAATSLYEVVADYAGPAQVAGYTVLFQGDDAWRAVAVFDLPDGLRTIAYSEDAVLLQQMQGTECCGLTYVLSDGQFRAA